MRSRAGAEGAILVVDDEEAALRGARRTLRSRGFQSVLTCSDPREVPDLLRDQPVALMLLDLIMPHVRGEEVLSQTARSHPELPVIVVTAEHEAAERCMELGAADYLVKPVDSDQLLAAVERTLESSALRERASGSGSGSPDEPDDERPGG